MLPGTGFQFQNYFFERKDSKFKLILPKKENIWGIKNEVFGALRKSKLFCVGEVEFKQNKNEINKNINIRFADSGIVCISCHSKDVVKAAGSG